MYGATNQDYEMQNVDPSSGKLINTFLKLLILISIFFAGGLSYKVAIENGLIESQTKADIKGVETSTINDNSPVQDRIRKLVVIPQNEDPTVATIKDVEQLKAANPEFYLYAENGDTLLIYSDRAIIFREEENLIINIVPVQRTESIKN